MKREKIETLKIQQIEYARIIASWVKDYFNSYKVAPQKDIMKLYRARVEELNDESLQENVLSFIKNLDENYDEKKISNVEFSINQSINYLKKRSLNDLVENMSANLSIDDVDKVESLLTKYKCVEPTETSGVSLLHNSENIANSFLNENTLLYEIKGAYGKVIGKIHREDFIAFLAPMKRGKCLAFGTKILMADGSIKEVQDLKVGDKLMGDDSTPRNVEIVSKGFGKMYRITSKVDSLRKDKRPEIDFTCNGDHILVLKNVWESEKQPIKEFRKDGHKNGEIKKNGTNNFLKQDEIEISVDDFMKLSDYQKKRFKLFRTKVEYPEKNHFINPYLLGLWLGDGGSTQGCITNIDKEIIDYCKKESIKINDCVSVVADKRFSDVKSIRFSNGKNKESNFHKELKRLNLLGNKHIPSEYMIDSFENRLNLLAGIIDTDGYASKDGKCYEIALMNETLAKDVEKLCQQLGFRTKFCEKYKKYKNMYSESNGWAYSWVIKIYGKLSTIPLLLERKKMRDSKKYNSLNNTFSFNIEYVGEDDFYGFVLDGNHRFLLADTTVSHNTFHLLNVCVEAMKNGLKVLFISLEMSQEEITKRAWTSLSGQLPEDKEDIDYPYFVENDETNKKWKIAHKKISRKAVSIDEVEKKQKNMIRMFRGGDIRIISAPAYGWTVEKIDTEIEKMIQQNGYVPDVITIDYADILAPSEKGEYRNQLDGIWKRLRGLAQRRKAVVFTATQSTREGLSTDVTAQSIAEDIRKLAHVTCMVALNQSKVEKEQNIMRLSQIAVREGDSVTKDALCLQCYAIGRPVLDSRFADEVEYKKKSDDDSEKSEKKNYNNKYKEF